MPRIISLSTILILIAITDLYCQELTYNDLIRVKPLEIDIVPKGPIDFYSFKTERKIMAYLFSVNESSIKYIQRNQFEEYKKYKDNELVNNMPISQIYNIGWVENEFNYYQAPWISIISGAALGILWWATHPDRQDPLLRAATVTIGLFSGGIIGGIFRLSAYKNIPIHFDENIWQKNLPNFPSHRSLGITLSFSIQSG